MDRRDFQGRQIDVVFAQERRKSSDQMRSRDGPYPVRKKLEYARCVMYSIHDLYLSLNYEGWHIK